VSAARKLVIRRAIPAIRKGNTRKGPGKNNTERGAPKGRRLQKTQQIGQKYKTGIWGCNFKKQLCLRMKRTSERITRRTSELPSLFDLFIAIRKVNENTFWKVRPPPKRKKELQTA
jgi:hypothetical protein